MARACGSLLLTFVAVAVGLTSRAEAEDEPGTIKLGVLTGMFRDVPPALVQAAATPFQDLFKRQTGLEGEVEMVNDCEALASKMHEKKLQIGVFHGFEWAWVRHRYPDLLPLVVTVPAKKPQACIVVHTDSKATGPADLTGKCVAVPVGTKAHCDLFIERLVKDLPAGCCTPAKQADSGSDELLDGVAGGKVTAALVDVAALNAYQNNKPGAATQLRVLVKSEPFPATVVAYRKDGVDASTAAKIRSGLVKAHTTSQGKAFLFLWKLKGFEDVPPGFDADLQQVLKSYPPPRLSKTPSSK